MKDEAVKSCINLDVIYQIEAFILNKLGWKLSLDTPQSLSIDFLKLIASFRTSQELDELICFLSSDFNRIFSFIHSEYSMYIQFNPFIWTVVILQFILIRRDLPQESSNLNEVINAIMGESKTDELPNLISCFDMVTNLFEQSQSQTEAEYEHISDTLLQTPIHTKIESLNIGTSIEKDVIDLINYASFSTNVESQNLSEIFIKEEYNSSEFLIGQNEMKPCIVDSYETGEKNEDDLELEPMKYNKQRNLSETSKFGLSLTHRKSRSQLSSKSAKTYKDALDEESYNFHSSYAIAQLKASKTELNYCSKHQSSSILKVMKRNSITKLETNLENNKINLNKNCSHDNSNCEISICRRKHLRLSLTKSSKK